MSDDVKTREVEVRLEKISRDLSEARARNPSCTSWAVDVPRYRDGYAGSDDDIAAAVRAAAAVWWDVALVQGRLLFTLEE